APAPAPVSDVVEVAAPAPPLSTAPAPTPEPESPAPTAPAPPPPVPPAPQRPPALSAAASLGEGDTGVVLAMAVPERVSPGNPQPDVDFTVGNTPVLGDAPPSKGNDVSVGGSLLPVSVSGADPPPVAPAPLPTTLT
ncbi:MAG: hypothetical protein ACRD0C_14590, partial [Acidimicrobiia bacterium]